MAHQSYRVASEGNHKLFVIHLHKRFILKNKNRIHIKKLKFISPTECIDMHEFIRFKSWAHRRHI